MIETTLRALLPQYDGVLLDAYGVLVDGAGALPGAPELISYLGDAGIPYLIVTNDASRLPATIAARLASLGMPVPAANVLTSGALIEDHFARTGLRDADTLVLGPADSLEYVRRAGGNPVALEPGVNARVIVVCDEDGYDFLLGVDVAMSAAFRQLDRKQPLSLVLPNPDVIYPKSRGEYGFTSGGVALLLEGALRQRYGNTAPENAPEFVRLGKPHPAMFERAQSVLPGRLLMVGDQLATDIAAANRCGLDSVLVTTGVDRAATASAIARPTYVVNGLD